VLSGRGLCDELITRPENSYRIWCVVACDIKSSRMMRLWSALGRSSIGERERERGGERERGEREREAVLAFPRCELYLVCLY
jgi:hypothetical protein